MAGLLSVTFGCTNVRHIGNVNGLELTRVTTRGVFSPSTTTVIVSDPKQPGTIHGPIANAQGPGFLPAVANAAGTAGGAALLRPPTTKVENGSQAVSTGSNANSFSNSSASQGGAAINVNANAGGSNTQNGSVHHNTGNGNGSGNNGNH